MRLNIILGTLTFTEVAIGVWESFPDQVPGQRCTTSLGEVGNCVLTDSDGYNFECHKVEGFLFRESNICPDPVYPVVVICSRDSKYVAWL